MESAGSHWERSCPRCGQQLTKKEPMESWQCRCGWGESEASGGKGLAPCAEQSTFIPGKMPAKKVLHDVPVLVNIATPGRSRVSRLTEHDIAARVFSSTIMGSIKGFVPAPAGMVHGTKARMDPSGFPVNAPGFVAGNNSAFHNPYCARSGHG
jgi:hypothetical protein